MNKMSNEYCLQTPSRNERNENDFQKEENTEKMNPLLLESNFQNSF